MNAQLPWPPLGPESPPAQHCVQCGRCVSSCPQARPPHYSPRRVLRLLQLGLREQAARHPFLYACKYCGKCLVNCPQGLAVARILKRLAFERVILC